MAWPRHSPSNAYTGSLNDTLERSGAIEVRTLRYGIKGVLDAVIRPVDVLHVHWFERAFWAPNGFSVLRQVVSVIAIAIATKARNGKIVWTVHDPQPHRSPLNNRLFGGWTGRLWKHYQRFLIPKVDGIFLMSASHRSLVAATHPVLENIPTTMVPHPHYLGQYPDSVSRAEARRKLGVEDDRPVLAFVGSLRVYKNPGGLMQAFSQLNVDAVLVVAGATETPEEAAALKDLAAQDPRIELHDRFVPDDELQYWLRAADLSVLPYRRVTNSGSAHLALSFDLPVLVPDEPVFEELENLVGARWVKRFNGDLSADHLAAAIAWARGPKLRPDLSALDWQIIADQTALFYRSVLGL
jgi:beta-1,4-mannosyltransferase